MEPVRVPLWEGRPPHSLGEGDGHAPFLDVYRPPPDRATGSAMLIFPGGAYAFLSEKSGAEYGRWLAGSGIAGLVVNFRLGVDGYHYPALLADTRQAGCVLLRRAAEWGVDAGRIGVIGTSAGGHLAALLMTGAASDGSGASAGGGASVAGGDRSARGEGNVEAEWRPAVGVLCYPVISMHDPLAHQESRGHFLGSEAGRPDLRDRFSADLRVDARTAPAFIWHTFPDPEVTVENSRSFAEALHAHGVPHELHLYEKGGHRLGLARAEGLHWTDDCIRWLRSHGF